MQKRQAYAAGLKSDIRNPHTAGYTYKDGGAPRGQAWKSKGGLSAALRNDASPTPQGPAPVLLQCVLRVWRSLRAATAWAASMASSASTTAMSALSLALRRASSAFSRAATARASS